MHFFHLKIKKHVVESDFEKYPLSQCKLIHQRYLSVVYENFIFTKELIFQLLGCLRWKLLHDLFNFKQQHLLIFLLLK